VVPPTTTIAPLVSGITDISTNFSVAINENGTGYYLVQAASSATPTIGAVMAGTPFTMNANVTANLTISGLTASSAYTIYFIAKDVANNVQAALQSVAVTTSAAPLPAGYIAQGGLIWMPTTSITYSWVNANSYCTNSTITINGLIGGWRLPTLTELSSLYVSGAMLGHGWTISGTWSSTPAPYSSYWLLNLSDGTTAYGNAYSMYVTCVR
jgi:hypothetical protein